MRKTAVFAAALAVLAGTAAYAQTDMQGHDNGTGGAGRLGPGMMSGTSSYSENPYWTAMRLIHHEKYADAIPYIDRAAADRPSNASILANAGLAHGKVGEFGDALTYLQKAIAVDGDNRQAHQYLGEVYLATHNASAAGTQLAELARICPSGCDEKDALTKAIAVAQTQASSAPAASPH